jgi:hypothetical protein
MSRRRSNVRLNARRRQDKACYNTLCIDCGMETQPREPNHIGKYEQYIVTDEVWQAAGMPKATTNPALELIGGGGCLCVGCIEKRLGRMLTLSDFEPRTVESMFNRRRAGWYTPRLAARICDPLEAALGTRPEETIELHPYGLRRSMRFSPDTPDTAMLTKAGEEENEISVELPDEPTSRRTMRRAYLAERRKGRVHDRCLS